MTENQVLPDLSAVILAGGQSRRIGQGDKAFLKLAGQRLIDRVIRAVEPLCTEVIIVTNTPAQYQGLGTRLVEDILPGKGALGGMYSGLQAAHRPLSLIVACDMPFLNQPLIRYMARLASDSDHDAVIPRVGKDEESGSGSATARERHLHPLYAIYRKTCLPAMEAAIEQNDLLTIAFLPAIRARFVEVEEIARFDPRRLSFFNINTPQDWERAQALLRSSIG
ncbi:MAG: molybdenum cofactor guanylyltransferase [Candidatus Bipolaricaulia bacterium]